MKNTAKNTIEFKVYGRHALFSDPVTKVGGEKCSYHLPTYEAVKGIVKSIYWKPTIIWVIDELRIINQIQTETKGMKPLKYNDGGNDLSYYTYLKNVEYQVRAHFEWNMARPELASDRIDGKHFAITQRSLEKGGRQDIFLGTRDCQGYVEPCEYGSDDGFYDTSPPITYGLMFHGFDYPDESGREHLISRFWQPEMKNGYIQFLPPEKCKIRKTVCPMGKKDFILNTNFASVDYTSIEWGYV